jgi:hypothetical protein
MILGGAVFFAVTLFSIGTDVPRDATWIFVPQVELTPQIAPDYQLIGVTLRLDLTNSSGHMLQVELDFMVNNKTRTYGLGIMQPLRVDEMRTAASNPNGDASHPITSVTLSGSYFTRSEYRFNSLGQASILLNVAVCDAITFWDFASRGTGFTFGSGKGLMGGGPDVDQFMENKGSTPDVILNNGLTLSAIYPASWQLSLSGSFPLPDKQFAVGPDRAATWFLNFNRVLPSYFETVELVWNIRLCITLRDFANFTSGIMIAFGSGIVIESTRRGRQSRK